MMDTQNSKEEDMYTPRQFVAITASGQKFPVILCRLVDKDGFHVVELEVRNEKYTWLAESLSSEGILYNDVLDPSESRIVKPDSGVIFLAALNDNLHYQGIYASEVCRGEIPYKEVA